MDSVRGPGGGYCLSPSSVQITVADIVRAVDEPLDATQCGGYENCSDEERCMTHELWSTLNRKMYEYLTSVTLFDLVDKQLRKAGAEVAVLKDARLPPVRSRSASGGCGLRRGRLANGNTHPRSPRP